MVCESCKLGYYKELYSGHCKPCENCDGNMCDGAIGSCNWGCEKGGTQKVDNIYVSTLVRISVLTVIVKESEESVNLVVNKGFMVLTA